MFCPEVVVLRRVFDGGVTKRTCFFYEHARAWQTMAKNDKKWQSLFGLKAVVKRSNLNRNGPPNVKNLKNIYGEGLGSGFGPQEGYDPSKPSLISVILLHFQHI